MTDHSRELAFDTTVRAFLNNTITADQFEIELRAYARAFEATTYKLGTAQVDWMKFPQERLFALLRVTSRITRRLRMHFSEGN